MSQLQRLVSRGKKKIREFCNTNDLDFPSLVVMTGRSPFSGCAYYRPTTITLYPDSCAKPAAANWVRNWDWPGSTVDREPFGVLCHELGHHVDCLLSTHVSHNYRGDFSSAIRRESGESALTGYCPNSAEWFAEMFRLFITNPDLLRLVRPLTYDVLVQRFSTVENRNWQVVLMGAPERIIRSNENKIRKVKC